MSIIVCTDCCKYVDTDFHEVFWLEGTPFCRCESCQEEAEEIEEVA